MKTFLDKATGESYAEGPQHVKSSGSIGCAHQFFTVRLNTRGSDEDIFRQVQGVQVMCALCGNQRQLWETGELNSFNKKTSLWESL